MSLVPPLGGPMGVWAPAWRAAGRGSSRCPCPAPRRLSWPKLVERTREGRKSSLRSNRARLLRGRGWAEKQLALRPSFVTELVDFEGCVIP